MKGVWRCLLVLGLLFPVLFGGLGQPIQDIKIQFLGAAGMVGGACFLVEADGFRFLVDCGSFYAEEGDEGGSGQVLLLVPSDIEAIILTHAHQDHWGRIPKLVLRDGWRGMIYMTEVTSQLLSYRANSRDRHSDLGAMYNTLGYLSLGVERLGYVVDRCEAARKAGDLCVLHASIAGQSTTLCGLNIGRSWGFETGTRDRLDGFRMCMNCVAAEVEILRSLFIAKGYGERWIIAPGISARFLNAGHIPGSAMVLLEFETEEGPFRVNFSGDLGPQTHSFVPHWEIPSESVDVLIIESTYGSSDRRNSSEELERFRGELVRALVDRGRRVIIPVFALDRAQRLLYDVGSLKGMGAIPTGTPVFLGGGTTAEARGAIHKYTELYMQLSLERARYADYFSSLFFEAAQRFEEVSLFADANPYGYRQLSAMEPAPAGPCIIIATLGDCSFSVSERLLCHLGGDPNTEFFLVSYAAAASPCGQIKGIAGTAVERTVTLSQGCSVRVSGERVHQFSAFSGHADAVALQGLVLGLRGLSSVFLVHGSSANIEAFRDRLVGQGLLVEAPSLGAVYQIFPRTTKVSSLELTETVLGSCR